jgi:hypothetical protein
VSRSRAFAVLLSVLLGLTCHVALAQAEDAPPQVSVTVDRTEVETQLGGKFSFRSTITNDGTVPAAGLIAHLNVLSIRRGTYVDPEDWSSDRTRYLDPIAPGASTTVSWNVHAVNDGSLALYVSVLPGDSIGVVPATSPSIRLSVAQKKTLNSGGILPLALGIPALIGLVTLGARARRGRRPNS